MKLFFRICGIALIVLGALLALAVPPAGLLFVALGIFFVISSRKKFPQNIPTEHMAKTRPTPASGSHTAPRVSTADSEYSGGPLFGEWDTSIHLAAGQLQRFGRASYGDFPTQPLRRGVVKIIGSKGDTYYTSLDSCDCPDFEKRHLPCKHIYGLALSLGYTSDDFYSSYLDVICSDGVIPRPVVGYSNGLHSYQVHGINPETGRKNKHVVYALNENDAVSAAHDVGLSDPIEVDGRADNDGFVPVSSEQLDYAKEYGVIIPSSADNADARALLVRFANSDMSAVPVGLLKFSTKLRLPFSLLTGVEDLLNSLLNKAPRRDQIALYAAAVQCSKNGVSLVDCFSDPVSDVCYSYADFAFNDEKLYRTLLNNLTSQELQYPSKKSPSYRSVSNFLSVNAASTLT